MEIVEDPRFIGAVVSFNAGEFREAADAFEDLYFEYTLEERELARGLMQLAVGCLHLSLGQRRPGVERLAEAVLALATIRSTAVAELVTDVQQLVARPEGKLWPVLRFATQSGSG